MTMSCPKPRAAERELARSIEKYGLKIWRRTVYGEVLLRSGNVCEICNKRLVNDIHHCYGRGRTRFDWREQADAMLAVCRKCHPQAIKHKPAGPKLAWVEEILERINAQVH